MPLTAAEQKWAAERAAEEHEQRVALLLSKGWERVSKTAWRKDTSDARVSETSAIEISADTPEDASRSARAEQARLDALARQEESRNE